MKLTTQTSLEEFVYNPEFPEEILAILTLLKTVEQQPEYHPEIWVYDHIKIVYDRAMALQDVNLMMSALFHDLGKLENCKPHVTKIGVNTFHDHEKESTRLVDRYWDWIQDAGCDYLIVRFIVENHMRIGKFDQMQRKKQVRLETHPHYLLLRQFEKCDDMTI